MRTLLARHRGWGCPRRCRDAFPSQPAMFRGAFWASYFHKLAKCFFLKSFFLIAMRISQACPAVSALRSLFSLRILCVLGVSAISFIFSASCLQAQTSTQLSRDGWSISANPASSELSISHGTLGTVLEHVRLTRRTDQGTGGTQAWSVEKVGDETLRLHTRNPRGAWVFKVAQNELRIFTTDSDALLIAQAPANSQRI